MMWGTGLHRWRINWLESIAENCQRKHTILTVLKRWWRTGIIHHAINFYQSFTLLSWICALCFREHVSEFSNVHSRIQNLSARYISLTKMGSWLCTWYVPCKHSSLLQTARTWRRACRGAWNGKVCCMLWYCSFVLIMLCRRVPVHIETEMSPSEFMV